MATIHDLDDLMRDTLKEHPHSSEHEIAGLLFEKVKANKLFLKPLFRRWFELTYPRFKILTADNQIAVLRIGNKFTERERPQLKKSTKDMKAALTRRLMQHTLSSGVALEFASKADCEREGGWLLAVAAALPTWNAVVGKHLTENNLVALYRRNETAKTA